MTSKVYTFAEIKKESEQNNSTLMVIHDGVYNVTDFLNEVSFEKDNFNSNY